jgi:HAD superfamily hydrolase (TIGR01490 family)
MGIAFFDMDKTLLSKSSNVLLVRYLLQKADLLWSEKVQVAWFAAQYVLHLRSFESSMASIASRVHGGNVATVRALCQTWFDAVLKSTLSPKAIERVRWHQQHGDLVWILTATVQLATEPVAAYLALPFICTRIQVQKGRFVAAIEGVPNAHDGKRYWAQYLADQQGISLSDCTFYTDSIQDLPLLEAVGKPVPVNPDRKLRALALQRHWPIEIFF